MTLEQEISIIYGDKIKEEAVEEAKKMAKKMAEEMAEKTAAEMAAKTAIETESTLLASLVKDNILTKEEAIKRSSNPELLEALLNN